MFWKRECSLLTAHSVLACDEIGHWNMCKMHFLCIESTIIIPCPLRRWIFMFKKPKLLKNDEELSKNDDKKTIVKFEFIRLKLTYTKCAGTDEFNERNCTNSCLACSWHVIDKALATNKLENSLRHWNDVITYSEYVQKKNMVKYMVPWLIRNHSHDSQKKKKIDDKSYLQLIVQ